jgi:hypothetical protein
MSNKKEYIYKFEEKDKNGELRKFAILNPSRRKKEEGELYYASKLSHYIASGILPRIVWDKVFKDNGGIISDLDKKQYSSLYVEMANLRNELDICAAKNRENRSEEENEKINLLEGEIIRVRRQMQEFEMDQINAFENTAEAKARNRTIIWWACNLAAEEKNGKFELLLPGESVDDKLDFYDSTIENDEFLSFIFSRINYLVTIWYVGGASSEEDFKNLDEEYNSKIKEEKAVDEIEEKAKLESPDPAPSESVEENKKLDAVFESNEESDSSSSFE